LVASTYLVDKRGQVRYWWYGEMNWPGMESENFMRSEIERFLAENESVRTILASSLRARDATNRPCERGTLIFFFGAPHA
jgi:hypothetical protein